MKKMNSRTTKQWLLVIAAALLTACSTIDDETASTAPVPAAGTNEQSTAVAADSSEVNQQVADLEQQLASMKVEWEQQKPALERFVSNEADLQFLIQTLADMSQLSNEPSRDEYLGNNVLSEEKRQESLNALQSLVSSQEELANLLVDISSVVGDIAAQRAAVDSTAKVESQPVATEFAATDSMGQSASEPQATESSITQASTECDCEGQTTSTGMQTTTVAAGQSQDGTSQQQRDLSWYAMTTPLPEAQPANSVQPLSQLDDVNKTGNQPIAGVQVKSFTRRSLPSELAAAGADLTAYSSAPKFAMSRKSLSDYVSQLAFKLAGNRQLDGNKIGVASFVFFDDQLEQTSSVGNQLAEELSTVLPGYGARVIEYKLTKKIAVGPTGDLSLSRDARKLRESQGMDYVLTGTMIPTRRGLQVNSRVVSTRNNEVIASASTLIPALVLQQL